MLRRDSCCETEPSAAPTISSRTVSACVAGVEAISRLLHPETPSHLGVLAAAGAIGLAGNWLAAIVRTRAGLADVGMVARPLRADEAALLPFPVGHDGLVFIVQQTNPVPGLSDEQVVREVEHYVKRVEA